MVTLARKAFPLLKTRQQDHPAVPDGFLETLVDNSPNIIFVKNKDFKIVYGNEAFLGMYPPERRPTIIGSTAAETFTEEEKKVFFAEDRKAFETGLAEIVEELVDYSGRLRVFQMSKIRFTDPETGEVFILGNGTDITRFAEREKQLAKNNLWLENFAALAAHDLRSPLAAIYSSLDLIHSRKETYLDPVAQEHVQLIAECLEGMIDQVTALLETYKNTAEENAKSFSECSISTLFEEVRFNLSTRIRDSRAKVLSAELPRMKVNKSLFRQLIHNLVENSLKYRSSDPPIIILRHETRDGFHHFSVDDNGIGISSGHRVKVFDLCVQGPVKMPGKNSGYGIGLALCKNIVELHGGKIWVDPDFSPGCRICFTIPLKA